jgi:peptide/nickel transport system ATP-binding protein
MGILPISDDVNVVADLADVAVVLRQGPVVECAPVFRFAAPTHTYTRALLNAVPSPHPDTVRHRLGPSA